MRLQLDYELMRAVSEKVEKVSRTLLEIPEMF